MHYCQFVQDGEQRRNKDWQMREHADEKQNALHVIEVGIQK